MTRRRWVVMTAGAVVVLAAVAAGVWWQARKDQVNGVGSRQSGGGSIALDTSGTGSTGAALQGDVKGQSTKVVDVSNGASAGSSGSGSTAAPDFKQYDQYKDTQSAYFGDLTVGPGAEVKAGSKVTLQYRGWLTDGKLFDDSYARGQALAFTVGEHRVIAGIEAGVVGMKAGGKRRIIVPPAAGYGDKGYGPVPGNAVLVFDVEVSQVQ